MLFLLNNELAEQRSGSRLINSEPQVVQERNGCRSFRGRLAGEPGAGGIAGSPRNRQGATYSVWSIPAMRKRRTPERISRPVCTWDTPGEDLAGIGRPRSFARYAGNVVISLAVSTRKVSKTK